MLFWNKLKKYDKKEQEKKEEEIGKLGHLERKDIFAMIISALFTIVPICLLVLLGISFFSLWVFGLL